MLLVANVTLYKSSHIVWIAESRICDKSHCGNSYSEKFEIQKKLAKVQEDTPVINFKKNVIHTLTPFQLYVRNGKYRYDY